MLDAEQTCVVVSVYNASPKMFSMITEKATVVVLDPVLRVTSDGTDISYKTIQVRCTCATAIRSPILFLQQVHDPNTFLVDGRRILGKGFAPAVAHSSTFDR